MASVGAQLVNLLPTASTSHECGSNLSGSSLIICLGNGRKWSSRLGPSETQREFRASGFGLVQPQLVECHVGK